MLIDSIPGVKDVEFDAAKDLVKVTGTMDVAALLAYLREKLSRDVEVVAPSKKDDGGDKPKEVSYLLADYYSSLVGRRPSSPSASSGLQLKDSLCLFHGAGLCSVLLLE